MLNAPNPQAAGSALTNSTTITDISPAPQLTLPANFLYPGAAIRVTAFGVLSTAASAQGTLTVGTYYGGVAGVSLADTGTPTPAASAANWPWRLEYLGTVRSNGSSGTIMGAGTFWTPTSLTAWTSIPIPSTALATVTIDTTSAKVISIGAKWGTASASNSITCHGVYIESMA